MTGGYEPLARNQFDQDERADHNRRNDREDGGAVQEEPDVDQPTAQCRVRQCDRCGEKHQNENEVKTKAYDDDNEDAIANTMKKQKKESIGMSVQTAR